VGGHVKVLLWMPLCVRSLAIQARSSRTGDWLLSARRAVRRRTACGIAALSDGRCSGRVNMERSKDGAMGSVFRLTVSTRTLSWCWFASFWSDAVGVVAMRPRRRP